MGLQFKDLVVRKEIAIKDLKGKVLAVDSMNLLYQFLTTIRSPDGTALTDSKGRVTSHLIGLFSRTTTLMENGLKLVFVFDGKAPEIKQKTWEKRTNIKKEAALKFKEAEEAGDVKEMRKFAARTAVLNKEMLSAAKELITALGLPIVQAPSEGEAQAAALVKTGQAYASVSQDYDTLIFGGPLVVRNLSIAGKRKKAGKLAYQTVKPETISLPEVLNHLKLNLDQLIVLAILSGTDYNPGGVKGIGPKTALKLVREYGTDFPALFKAVDWPAHCELDWQEIFQTIKEMPVLTNCKLEWQPLDEEKVWNLLVKDYEFGADRVRQRLDQLKESQQHLSQKGLGSFF